MFGDAKNVFSREKNLHSPTGVSIWNLHKKVKSSVNVEFHWLTMVTLLDWFELGRNAPPPKSKRHCSLESGAKMLDHASRECIDI